MSFAPKSHRSCAPAARKLAILFAVCTVCALAGARQEPAGSHDSDDSHAIAKRSFVKGVPNFGAVDAMLFRGAQPTREGFGQLAAMGIAIVVDLRKNHPLENAEVTRLGMQYVAIPWECYHPRNKSIAEFLSLIRNNPGKKIFVYCHLGTDRTGMMIAAFRMSQQGWSAAEARREMEAFGFSFEHKTICPGLERYEKSFPNDYLTSPVFRDLRAGQTPAGPRP